jgi:hypothetical protein
MGASVGKLMIRVPTGCQRSLHPSGEGFLQHIAMRLTYSALWMYEGLLRRPAKKGSGSPRPWLEQERGRTLVRGEPLIRQALR